MSLSTSFCLRPGRFLLPGNETDMTRWPVVACDQYTSQPEYWEKAAQLVGSSPSTLSLILPECYLADSAARVPKIHENMRRYLREGIFSRQVNGLVLIRRTIHMLQKQLAGLGESFAESGGLRERMTAVRLAAKARNRTDETPGENVPSCPKCGRPMRKRVKRDTGEAFWGCTGYAEGCRGTRPMVAER